VAADESVTVGRTNPAQRTDCRGWHRPAGGQDAFPHVHLLVVGPSDRTDHRPDSRPYAPTVRGRHSRAPLQNARSASALARTTSGSRGSGASASSHGRLLRALRRSMRIRFIVDLPKVIGRARPRPATPLSRGAGTGWPERRQSRRSGTRQTDVPIRLSYCGWPAASATVRRQVRFGVPQPGVCPVQPRTVPWLRCLSRRSISPTIGFSLVRRHRAQWRKIPTAGLTLADRRSVSQLGYPADDSAKTAEERTPSGPIGTGSLDGISTSDRRRRVDRGSGDNEFMIPGCSDSRAITGRARQRLDVIAVYRALLDRAAGSVRRLRAMPAPMMPVPGTATRRIGTLLPPGQPDISA
jgi:hypothetical protein